MAAEPDDPFDRLSNDEKERLVATVKDTPDEPESKEWTVEDFLQIGLSRREAMVAAAGVMSGMSVMAAVVKSIGTAEADASTTDSDGDVGAPNDRVDGFFDGFDTATQLTPPRYTSDSNAPNDTLYFDPDTDTAKYKDGNGNVYTAFTQATLQDSNSDNVDGGNILQLPQVEDSLDGQGGAELTAFDLVDTVTLQNHNYVEPQVTATESTSYTADLTQANYHKVTLTGDVSFDFANVASSDTNSVVLQLVQDSTGGRTPSFTPTVVWGGGSVPSWSTSAGAEDVITLVYDQDGSQWLGFVGGIGMA